MFHGRRDDSHFRPTLAERYGAVILFSRYGDEYEVKYTDSMPIHWAPYFQKYRGRVAMFMHWIPYFQAYGGGFGGRDGPYGYTLSSVLLRVSRPVRSEVRSLQSVPYLRTGLGTFESKDPNV